MYAIMQDGGASVIGPGCGTCQDLCKHTLAPSRHEPPLELPSYGEQSRDANWRLLLQAQSDAASLRGRCFQAEVQSDCL